MNRRGDVPYLGMIKLLEQAITKVQELPEEDQEVVAAVMLSMAGADAPVVRLDDKTRGNPRGSRASGTG